jgi:Na+/phosphate symporter
MRLITGILFGFGLMFFAMPYMGDAFHDMARTIEDKFSRADVDL